MLYLVAYLAMGTVASLLGVAATAWGLKVAIDLGAGAITLLCVSPSCSWCRCVRPAHQ
jgi:hypothetical protein